MLAQPPPICMHQQHHPALTSKHPPAISLRQSPFLRCRFTHTERKRYSGGGGSGRVKPGGEREMGNCQVTEAAMVVIQHPGGRVERLYGATPASEVMRCHPGHYVALCLSHEQRRQPEHHQGERFTRVRLLRHKDTLVLGQVYHLVTSQEVMKALRERKQEKMRAAQKDILMNQGLQQQTTKMTKLAADEHLHANLIFLNHSAKIFRWVPERGRRKAAQSSAARLRQWRPSLQSISEASN